jgi:hypothetical protein
MIHLQQNRFVDSEGRVLQLHGVNLGGSSKVPTRPNGATWNKAGFYDHRNISFVGRPFPLAESDEHFQRLRGWGFPLLRFLVTWEAIEHAGPGIYDQDYLEYLYQVVKKAGEYGLEVWIDPHQDVWSRFTGGDGAPGWTLEAIGMDVTRLHAAGAALLHQEHGPDFPTMIWPTNINRLAAATLFTLFFGGRNFAPKTKVDGLSIQEYLQSHYINAITQVALKLKDLPNVIGYGTLNEPYAGYIGAPDVAGRAKTPLLKGDSPTIFQAMLLGSGYPQEVDVYDLGLTGFVKKKTRRVNPKGVSIWRPGYEDIWKQNGVWGLNASGQPRILIPDYFSRVTAPGVSTHPVDFYRDYFKPFANRFARQIRAVLPDAIIFVEGVPQQAGLTWGPEDAANIVHAGHWYDGLTLMSKRFNPWFTIDPRNIRFHFGKRGIRACFADQIADIARHSDEQMGGIPTLIGETGIPFDMEHKRAYGSGDFSAQIQALDAILGALESNFASFTLWNYTADNTNERGDQWNDEDLSIFSRDQQKGTGGVYDGGRALPALIRPYAVRIPGRPVCQAFDIRSKVYHFAFHFDAALKAPLEVFLPAFHYPTGVKVEGARGEVKIDLQQQRLEYFPQPGEGVHNITIRALP